jgi:tetratricopeptide (TPR) repeat protein
MSCRAIREWLHVDAAALDEAQRLRFDDHLASCAECRGDRERMRVVRDVGRSLPVPAAGSREYSRAIARALLEGAAAPAPRRRPLWLVPLAIGALVATAAAAVVIARRDDESPRAPQVVIPAPAPAQVQHEAAVVQEQPPAPKQQVVKKQVAKQPRVDVIAEARVQLAAGHYAEAEKSVLVLLEKSQSRAEQAEAWMFLADLAQASGNLGTAVTRYQTVATKFADLPAAESALYAAARIEARRGRRDAARALYDQYLERYANGRYAEDVRDKRRQLR